MISTEPTTTSTRTPALAGVGGALWLLLPVAWAASELSEQEYGSLGFVAVAVSFWACLVLAPALLAAAAWGLRTPNAGRARTIGAVTAAAGLALIALGNAVEVGSMSLGGEEVPWGHAVFFVGFLVSLVGGVVLGITLIRRRRDGLGRAAGWLLALALPLGVGIGYLGALVAPDNDAGFWAAVSVPTGLAFLLLGRALATGRPREGVAPE